MRAAGAAKPLLAVALAKVLVSGAVLLGGFRALSDDDFARVVIAQRFAESPSLDPSGTSWLPLPFWVYGAALKLFGSTLGVARATAVVLGVAAALVLYGAARLLSFSPRAAVFGAILASLLPWNAFLGVATVPEAPSAALCVLAVASLVSTDDKLRLLGAAALGMASASRYEPWAAAAVFSASTAADAVRRRSPALWAAAALGALFPLLWLAHGVFRHGDALFFVQRVTAYQSALGGVAPLAERVSRYPLALFQAELELALLVLGACIAAWKLGLRSELARLGRPALALGGLLLFLVYSDVRGGTATHHAERALLPLWLFGALVTAGIGGQVLARIAPVARGVGLGAALVVVAGIGLVRGARPPFDRGADRSAEIAIGEKAREHGVERLAVDTPDFGFYAVMAALGAPSRAVPIDDRDPRRKREADAFASEEALSVRLAALGARWLVTTRAHAPLAERRGRLVHANEKFVLVELDR